MTIAYTFMVLAELAVAAAAAAAGATTGGVDNTLLWGPYRPNVYFGMRPRLPNSLNTGLMWYSSSDYNHIQDMKHDVKQEDSVLYGWDHYDVRKGGVQRLNDPVHAVNLTTSLLKSEDGLSWIVRYKGETHPENIITMVNYIALDGPGNLRLESPLMKIGIDGDVQMRGSTADLGAFSLKISEGKGDKPYSDHPGAMNSPASQSQYLSISVPDTNFWRAKEIYVTLAQEYVQAMSEAYADQPGLPAWALFSLANDDSAAGNFHFVQKVFKGSFEYDMVYTADGSLDSNLNAKKFESQMKKHVAQQQKQFDKAYKLSEPYTDVKYQEFARKMISSLAGGIGYFHGDDLIGNYENPREPSKFSQPHELYTCTPTRSFFPRGFYWDEGFHLLGLVDYDQELVVDILDSWFNVMNEDGWIAREQILGPESRSRVPEEFQVQYPTHANPPTLVLLLSRLGDSREILPLLQKLYPKLQTHFNWFRRTQKGEMLELDRDAPSLVEAYRWRGRTKTHVLTSGFDDYPRAEILNDGELHVDLLAWVGAMARALKEIATMVGDKEGAARYSKITDDIVANLKALHWSEEQSTFCDVTVNEYDEDEHVCHIGYVSHLPFFLRLVDLNDRETLLPLLQQLSSPDLMWSKFGLRSLSLDDEFYGTSENYWRGPIWNNMNYLALEALEHYAQSPDHEIASQSAKLFNELRRNVVDNIYNQWLETGSLWESYHSDSGLAKGAKQFTGWTALAARMMAMPQIALPAAPEAEAEGAAEHEAADEAEHEDL